MTDNGRAPGEDEVRLLLRGLPSPVMPDAVSDRITSALRESAAQARGSGGGTRGSRPVGAFLVAAAAAILALFIGASLLPSAEGTSAEAAPPLIQSGSEYTSETLETGVLGQLDDQAEPDSVLDGTFAETPLGLRDCLAAIPNEGRLLMIEKASFAGNPAMVLVTSHLLEPRFAEIWVVARRCTVDRSGLVDHRLVSLTPA